MRCSGYVQNVNGKNVTVDGITYSTFSVEQVKASVGDFVEFEFTEKNAVNRSGAPVVYRNIKGTLYGKPGITGGSISVGPGPVVFPSTPVGPRPPVREPLIGAPKFDTQRLILRQNALTNAVNWCHETWDGGGLAPTPDRVIEIAKLFEAYTSGDADYEEVRKSLEGASSESE